jgi:hypothetical protein
VALRAPEASPIMIRRAAIEPLLGLHPSPAALELRAPPETARRLKVR